MFFKYLHLRILPGKGIRQRTIPKPVSPKSETPDFEIVDEEN